jgi:RNA polymerase sigma-70 factor (ECF subfamily)
MLDNTFHKYPDQDLVALLKQGKPEAIGLIYDKYAPNLLGLITRMMGNQETAEIILQETFVAIWQQKDTYNDTRLRFLSWLILITRDTALAALKSGKYTTPDKTPGSNNTASTEDKTNNFIANLRADEKAALDLVYLKGYPCAEAATLLGLPEDTVKTILQTACKHLRAGKKV